MDFGKILKRKTLSADSIRQAIAEAEAAREAARGQRVEINRRRPEAFLEGDDAVIDRLEADLAKANREEERLGIVLDELRKRHAAAKKAEERASRDQVYAAARTATKRYAANTAKFKKLADELADILAELSEDAGLCKEATRIAREAGDDIRIEPPGRAVSTRSDGRYGDLFDRVELPNPTDIFGPPIWPVSEAQRIENNLSSADRAARAAKAADELETVT